MKYVADWLPLWPWVRQGLDKMQEKVQSRELPEHIFMSLHGRSAHLYVFEDEGFFVLQQRPDPDGVALFVRAMWFAPGSYADNSERVQAELTEIARGIGAKRIAAISPRPGWARESFLTETARVYEHELN